MIRIVFAGIFLVIVSTGCSKKDAPLPDNFINLESATQGIGVDEQSRAVKLTLSRAESKVITATLTLNEEGVVYGVDYTTSPAASAGKIDITIPAGSNEASFTINKISEALFDGDEKLKLSLGRADAPLVIGQTNQYTLSFSEIVSDTASATINGGGPTYPNKVFIDLSANRQTAVERTGWDLGFYTSASDFRVILNSSVNMMVRTTGKTNIADVNAADTAGLSAEVSFNQLAPSVSQLPYIDYPTGDLSQTAIAAVSATADDNKVYIVNRGNGVGTPGTARGWKKVRILRNANGGYTLQHADIASPTFQEISIAKDTGYFFKAVSFESGLVNVEPKKDKWDIAWTYFVNVTNFGSGLVPYLFQDIILQNRNVMVAKVLTADRAFADFSETHLAGLTFSNVQTAIGSDWRSGGGPSSLPSIRTDRYYIVKDGAGNVYKLRFTALTKDGQRGYPSYESVLIKKA